mmetsp:Transcript_39313/g.93119  ORF Transcript_39313/g.93119 Transcript_39313/m.93119 type:complete len:327 (-) Transcript_39313:544-1524(-)
MPALGNTTRSPIQRAATQGEECQWAGEKKQEGEEKRRVKGDLAGEQGPGRTPSGSGLDSAQQAGRALGVLQADEAEEVPPCRLLGPRAHGVVPEVEVEERRRDVAARHLPEQLAFDPSGEPSPVGPVEGQDCPLAHFPGARLDAAGEVGLVKAGDHVLELGVVLVAPDPHDPPPEDPLVLPRHEADGEAVVRPHQQRHPKVARSAECGVVVVRQPRGIGLPVLPPELRRPHPLRVHVQSKVIDLHVEEPSAIPDRAPHAGAGGRKVPAGAALADPLRELLPLRERRRRGLAGGLHGRGLGPRQEARQADHDARREPVHLHLERTDG